MGTLPKQQMNTTYQTGTTLIYKHVTFDADYVHIHFDNSYSSTPGLIDPFSIRNVFVNYTIRSGEPVQRHQASAWR